MNIQKAVRDGSIRREYHYFIPAARIMSVQAAETDVSPVLLKGKQLLLQLFRFPEIIAVLKCNQFTSCQINSSVSRHTGPGLLPEPVIADSVVMDLQNDIFRMIRRTVVNDYYFQFLNRLVKHAPDGTLYSSGTVEGRNDYRNQHRISPAFSFLKTAFFRQY